MIKILIVEDEKPIADLVRLSLLDAGYGCTCVYDGQSAADIIEQEAFDLAILDVMLPHIDGYELMEYLNYYRIPAIFLTARTAVKERVRGLKAGAEDYISKPFEIIELLARVETVLRRYNKGRTRYTFADICIDTEARLVYKEGQTVDLTAKEFDLLMYLAQNRNKALYRSQIYAHVWGGDDLGDSRTVDLHVQRLRKKLQLPQLVPVYRIGYRLEVQG